MLGVWLTLLLSLLNWVRTRRLALALLLLFAIDVALSLSGGRHYGGIWLYPGFITTMGLVMLLLRLWPRWRLLRRPLPKRLPPRTPVAGGVLEASPWPKKQARGITTVTVLVGFVMVLTVAAAAVSFLVRATLVSRHAERSLVATALLQGELERVRAGEVAITELEEDLSARAGRLLPKAAGRAIASRADEPDLMSLRLQVSWQEPGRPRHKAELSGLVHAKR